MQGLPAPVMTSEPGSFAQRTIVERKPRIIDRVLATNPYPHDIRSRLMSLRDEIGGGQVHPPSGEGDPNGRWHDAWAPWRGCTWLQLPWFFAEAFFYRRLLEAVCFFSPGPWHGRDPFGADKAEALDRGLRSLSPDPPSREPDEILRQLLLCSLWGNQVDLSNNSVEDAVSGSAITANNDHLLIDHTVPLVRRLAHRKTRTVHIVCDNAGPELLADLLLIRWLLENDWIDRVCLHLKTHPFFVSDATLLDLLYTFKALCESSASSIAKLGAQIKAWFHSGRLQALTSFFWNSHLGFRHLPPELLGLLAGADLVLFKGDANYRRLLDDRHWSPTDAMESITSYLPFPFACLRTIKAELIIGLSEGMAEKVAQRDPDWLTNGRWGLVHCVPNGKIKARAWRAKRRR